MSSLPPRNYLNLGYVQQYNEFAEDPESALKPNETNFDKNANKSHKETESKGYDIQGQVIDTSDQLSIDVNKMHNTCGDNFQEPITGWSVYKLEDKKNAPK